MTGLMAVSYDIGFILVSLYVTFSLGKESFWLADSIQVVIWLAPSSLDECLNVCELLIWTFQSVTESVQIRLTNQIGVIPYESW